MSGRRGVVLGWLQSVRCHCSPLGGGSGLLLPYPRDSPSWVRLGGVELVMETQISAAWLGSARPKVPVKKPHTGEWGMIDLRGWENLCMLDSRRGYQCQTDYHCSSLISTSHTSHYSWTPSLLSSQTPPHLPLPLLPTETLKRPLQCLLREIQSWSANILLAITTPAFFLWKFFIGCVYLIWFEMGPKPQYQMHKCINRSLSTLGTERLSVWLPYSTFTSSN